MLLFPAVLGIAADESASPVPAAPSSVKNIKEGAKPGHDGEAPELQETAPAAAASEQPAARSAADSFVLEKGVVRNIAHGFRFPVPGGWTMKTGATAEKLDFALEGCEDCLLRVVVSPGNTLPLDQTVKAIHEQIASNPSARVVGEEPIKVARQAGYTLVKEEPGGAPPDAGADDAPPADAAKPPTTVRTRYVTFGYESDKYYIVLRAPKERFAAEDQGFETLLEKFRFGAVTPDRPKSSR